jgi:hypothetical protein
LQDSCRKVAGSLQGTCKKLTVALANGVAADAAAVSSPVAGLDTAALESALFLTCSVGTCVATVVVSRHWLAAVVAAALVRSAGSAGAGSWQQQQQNIHDELCREEQDCVLVA